MITARMTLWAGNVAHMGEMINGHRVLVKNVKERDAWDLGVEGRIILKWILKIWEGVWTGFIGKGWGQATGDGVHGNGSSSSIRSGEFLYRFRNYQRLRKDSGPLFYKSQHC
jgi:hypothetical protein